MNDFDNYADLYNGVTAAQIRAAAEEPAANARVIADIATELGTDADAVTGSTEGEITSGTRANAQTVQQSAVALSQAGTYGVAALEEFASHVEAFDTKVADLNQRLRTNVASAQRLAGQAAAENDEDPPEYAETWAAIRASLVPEYNSALATLDDNAEASASRFEQGPTLANVKDLVLAGLIPYTIASGMWPNLTLTADERRQALQNEVANMTPAEQAAWVRANADVDPAIVDVISPEAQEILAGDVADDIADPRSIDADTVRLLDLFKEQEAFAHALYSNVTPGQVSDAIQHLSVSTFPDGSTQPVDVEQAQMYADFLSAAGVTFATYTKGTGEYAPPSDLSDQWYRAITDEERPHNAAALTMLINYGGRETSMDAGFLGDLTNKVYDWERSHDGAPVWGPLSDPGGHGYHSIKDPTVDLGDPDDPYDDWAGYTIPFDGLANLLGAMENTPQAAERFFAYDGTGARVGTVEFAGQDVNEKLKYLLSDRRWPADDGDGFGIALEGATLSSRDAGSDSRETPGERSAALASQMVFIIGEEVGRGDSWRPGDDGWQVPSGMTDSVGKILGGYVPDLNRIAQGSGETITGGDWVWGDSPGEGDGTGIVGMLGSNDHLATVLQSIGRGDDKTGLEYVTAAVLHHHNEENVRLIDAARMPDGSRPETIADLRQSNLESLLQDEAARGGRTLSMVMNNGFLGGEAQEKATQEQRDAIAKAFGAATDFVPTPQGKIAGFLTSQGLSALGDQISNQPSSVTAAWAADSDRAINESLNFQTYNSLLANGFLQPGDPDGLPASAIITGADGRPQIDPNLYNGRSDEVDPVAQREFNTWLSTSAYSGLGQSAINAYASNLPNFR